MPLTAILYTLSSVPLFASRPFLAAFVTSLLARFGSGLPFVGEHAMITALSAAPEWFRSPTCVALLGLFALLEVLSSKSVELRQLLEQVDGLVKAAVSMLVAFAVIDVETAGTVGAIQQAGISFQLGWVPVVGAATWAAANLRRGAVELIHEADEGDTLGLQSLLAWVENSWTILGLLFLVILPLAALLLSALTVFGLWYARRRALEREERRKVPCAACGTPLRLHATRCHACEHAVEAPHGVGVFGQPLQGLAQDPQRHAFDLVARKRCPRCAGRLPERAVRQACGTCGRVTFVSPSEFERYLDVISARLPRTLLISFALGAVPLLGVIPAVVYYRLNLVAGLRGYIPPLRGCTTRWLVRLLHIAVIALQPIPLVGAVVLPLMCWSTYAVYRRSLAGRARAELLTETA